MSTIQAIGKAIGSPIAKATELRPVKKLAEAWHKNPADVLTAATVAGIVAKDGIGCVMYVTQSLNNKKIPDERRKFVASLDLTNGVLMIAAQLAMFFAMRKYSGPLFEKIFKKSFNPKIKSEALQRIRMQDAAKNPNSVPKKLDIEKDYNKVKKDALELFKFVIDLAAVTIVGKRVIVPLIATPLAKKVEAKMNGKQPKKPEDTTNRAENSKVEEHKEEPKEEQKPVPTFSNSTSTNLLDKYRK